MKRKFLLLFAVLLTALSASAWSFQYNGIYYTITSSSPRTVEVTYRTANTATYSGSVNIPPTAYNGSTAYTVTGIGESAFEDCQNLTSVTIPSTVTSIGRAAFAMCTSLRVFRIPESVTWIGGAAFANTGIRTLYCDAITPPATSSSNTQDDPFGPDTYENTILFVPNNLKPIYQYYDWWREFNTIMEREYSFWANGIFYNVATVYGQNTAAVTKNYSALGYYSGAIAIPPTVTFGGITYTVVGILESAFQECQNLTEVTIPNTATYIGKYAFRQCTALTSVTIPGSVNVIRTGAFKDIPLESVKCLATTPPTIDNENAFDDNTYYNAPLTVPRGCKSAYQVATGWRNFRDIRELPYDFNYNGIFYAITGSNTVEVTNNGGCNTYSGIISIPPTVPHGGKTYTVTGIGEDAFWFSEYELGAALKSVSIPNTVTYIGNAAFANCSGLTSMTIPNSVLTIGNAAFFSCGGLTSLTIGNSVTTIGEDAFGGLHMTSLTIPASVTYIGDGAFSGNQYLETVTCLATTPPATGGGVFDQLLQGDFENDWTEATLYVPRKCKSVYQSAPEWEHFPVIREIPYDFEVDNIYYAFNEYYNAVEVTNNGEYGTYCGNISIPSSVRNGNKTYPVTAIGDYAFAFEADGEGVYYGQELTSVTIPNSVTRIGYAAFEGCNGLTSIVIPNSVTTIDGYAFLYCRATNVSIGNSVSTIGEYAFSYCGLLESVVIPASVTNIGDGAFSGCLRLSSVTCLATTPPNINNRNVFDNATYSSATLSVLGNVKSDYQTYYGWRFFTNIVALPNYDFVKNGIYYRKTGGSTAEVTNNGYNTYSGNVTIPSTVYYNGTTYKVTSVGINAFSGCTNLTGITFGQYVTVISDRAFYQCGSSLTKLTLPNSLITIGNEAFYQCYGLTGTLEVPNSVSTIGDWAFAGCNFTKVLLGEELHSIGDGAFDQNLNLTQVWCLALNPPLLGGFSHHGDVEEEATLWVPPIALASYQNGYHWDHFTDIRPLNFDFMVNGLGYKITSMNTVEASYCDPELSGEVIIPEVVYNYYIGDFAGDFDGNYSVTGIGEFAFYDMTLTGAVIPNTVIYIGDNAFGESDLSSVTIGNSVTSIGKYAFYLTPLTSVTIPNSVESIGLSAFEENWQLESVTIGSGVTTIGNYAFGYCSALTSVTCLATTPPNLAWENYNYNVFDQTTYANATLTVPANALRAYETTGGWNRFNKTVAMPIYDFVVDGIYYNITSDFSVEVTYGTYGNTYSGDVTIPASVSNDGATYLVTAIGDYAFRASTGLTSVSMPETVTRIGYRAFYRCDSSFRSVTLPNSLITIDDEAFASTWLEGTLIVPNTVTTIGENAFGECSFTEITLGSGLVEIGMFAFDRNDYLRRVTCLALTPPLLHGFSYDWDEANATLYVPYHSLAAYQAEEDWSHFGSIQRLAYDFKVDGLGYLFLEDDAVEIATHDYRIIHGDVVIPEEVTFMGTTYQITRIGNDAFYSCVGMLSVEIPNTVTSIGDTAFGECQYLASVTIPSSVTSIEDYAFTECYNLRDVTCLAITPPTLYGQGVFEQNTYTSCILKVPAESVSDYQEAYVWSNFSRIIANAIPGDVNGDGIVGIADVTTIIDSILSGNSDYNPVADFNGDGVVGIADVTAIIDSILGN